VIHLLNLRIDRWVHGWR